MLNCLIVDEHGDRDMILATLKESLNLFVNVAFKFVTKDYLSENSDAKKYDVIFIIFNDNSFSIDTLMELNLRYDFRHLKKKNYKLFKRDIDIINKAIFAIFLNEIPHKYFKFNHKNICIISDIGPNKKKLNVLSPLIEENAILVIGNFDDGKEELISILRQYSNVMLAKHFIQKVSEKGYHPNDHIIHSIEFSPEYHQAGLGILNYFSTIIHQRYPEIPVLIRIEQEGFTVRMIIETPEGHRETVEHTLQEYGLVVTGKMAPEQLLEDPYQVMALKHKLEMATLEVRHNRDLLQLSQQHGQQQQARITSLEADVTHLRELIGNTLQHNQNLTNMLQPLLDRLSQQHDTAVQQALSTLKEVIERGITPNDEKSVKDALATIQEKEPGVFLQMIDLIGKGAISGSAGRMFYDWAMHIGALLR